MEGEKNLQKRPNGANNSGKGNPIPYYYPYGGVKKSIKKEDMAVYETLRNEIISTQGIRTTLVVYMYTVYCAIVTFESVTSKLLQINNKISFVVSVVILVLFQSKIHRCSFTFARISAYIIAFFETDRGDINWEKANFISGDDRKAENKIILFLSSTGAPFLGVLSFLGYLGEIKTITNAGFFDYIFIVLFVLCIFYLWVIRDEYAIAREEKLKMVRFYSDYKIRKS